VKAFVRLYRMSKTEVVLSVVAFLGVALVGVLQGIVIAVALSFIAFVERAWRPHRTELGRVDGLKGYHDRERHPEGRRIPGLLIVRWDAPLFFANGGIFDDSIRKMVRQVEDNGDPVRWVVLAAEPITGLDTTAVDDVAELDDHLEHHDVRLVFAELKDPIRERLVKYGLGGRFADDRFFPTLGSAVKAYLEATGTEWTDWEDREERGRDDDPPPG